MSVSVIIYNLLVSVSINAHHLLVSASITLIHNLLASVSISLIICLRRCVHVQLQLVTYKLQLRAPSGRGLQFKQPGGAASIS